MGSGVRRLRRLRRLDQKLGIEEGSEKMKKTGNVMSKLKAARLGDLHMTCRAKCYGRREGARALRGGAGHQRGQWPGGRRDGGSWNAVRRGVALSIVDAPRTAKRRGHAGAYLGRGGRACCARRAQMENLLVCRHDVSQ